MIQYWKYENKHLPEVVHSYCTRKTVKNKNFIGPYKKKTKKENEILPAVDETSPGAKKTKRIVTISLNETILNIWK